MTQDQATKSTRPAKVQARLRRETHERLKALAKATDRDVSYLMSEAAERYVEQEAWQVEAIAEAVAHADAGGPFVAHEDAMAYLDAVARGEKPKPPRGFATKP